MMINIKNLVAVLLIGVSVISIDAHANPPSMQEIIEYGITFKQLAEIQLERDRLFPSHLRRFGSLPDIQEVDLDTTEHGFLSRCLMNVTSIGERAKDSAQCYLGAVLRHYFKPGVAHKDAALLKPLFRRNKTFEHNLTCFEQALIAVERNPIIGKNIGLLADYALSSVDNLAFFRTWRDGLSQMVALHGRLQGDLDELIGDDLEKLEQFRSDFANKSENLKLFLQETGDYLEFEEACMGIRQRFNAQEDIVLNVVLDQILRGTSIEFWLGDLLRFGILYGQNDIHEAFTASAKEPLSLDAFLWTLQKLNLLTRRHADDSEILRTVDAAYRIAYLMLQNSHHTVDYRDLMLERQLAMNGVTLTEAYRRMLAVVFTNANPQEWKIPAWENMLNGLSGMKYFFEKNALEAEVFAAEIAHAYSILTHGSQNVLGQLRDMGANVLNRASATDYVRDVVFGKYDPIYEDSIMPTEFIAFAHLASKMKYIVSSLKGMSDQNVASSVAMVAASAIGVSTGVLVSGSVLMLGKGLLGAVQARAERKIASIMTSQTEVQALLSGLLKTFDTGDVAQGLKRAASFYAEHKIASTIGTSWCDFREGRLKNIALRVAAAAPLIAIPVCMGLSYYGGYPIEWVGNRELIHGAAVASVWCASQIENPTKSERIENRIDQIKHEFCEKIFANNPSNHELSSNGLMQLQMIYKGSRGENLTINGEMK